MPLGFLWGVILTKFVALASASHTPELLLLCVLRSLTAPAGLIFRQSGPRFIYSCFDEYVQNLILEILFIHWYTKIMVSPPSSSAWTDNDGAWQALHLRTTIELSGPRCTVELFGPTRR